MAMEMNTRYGYLSGAIDIDMYEDGSVKSANFSQENVISFGFTHLIPQYGDEDPRKKHIKSIGFYNNGDLKRIALAHQTEVPTPIGEFPAELLTFYEGGYIKRIFPLNGKISGFWSEADEKELAIPFNFEFEFGAFTAKLISICFYESGDIKNITLFPGEVITLTTPIGEMKVRTGFSLYESGALKSVEPESPVLLRTKIGNISAYDISAVGIHADNNSLKFAEDGTLIALTTTSNRIVVQTDNAPMETIEPQEIANPLNEEETTLIPVKVVFDGDKVILDNGKKYVYLLEKSTFTVLTGKNKLASSCTDCSTCNLCN